jgi:hypothetical protein
MIIRLIRHSVKNPKNLRVLKIQPIVALLRVTSQRQACVRVRECATPKRVGFNQTIDSMQPPGIQILLIYTRTDVSCKRNYGVDGRRLGTFAYKMLK